MSKISTASAELPTPCTPAQIMHHMLQQNAVHGMVNSVNLNIVNHLLNLNHQLQLNDSSASFNMENNYTAHQLADFIDPINSMENDSLTHMCRQLLQHDQAEFIRVCITLHVNAHAFLFSFLLDTVLVGFLCLSGLIGNILSFVVLWNDTSAKGSTSFLLKALCIADSLFLVECFFYFTLRSVYPYTGWLRSYYHFFPWLTPYLWSSAIMTQTLVNWMVVLVTAERYVVVCQPFRATRLCSPRRVKTATACAALIALIYNLPRFFEWKVNAMEYKVPCQTYEEYRADDSELRMNTAYRAIYRVFLYSVLVALGPVTLLLGMNIRLIFTLREARDVRSLLIHGSPPHATIFPADPIEEEVVEADKGIGHKLSRENDSVSTDSPSPADSQPTNNTKMLATTEMDKAMADVQAQRERINVSRSDGGGANSQSNATLVAAATPTATCHQRDKGVTFLIVVIVTVFILCETPALIHQVLAAASPHIAVNYHNIFIYTVTLSNTLVALKSSSHFLIYCCCGRKFRYILRRLLRTRCSTRMDSNLPNYYQMHNQQLQPYHTARCTRLTRPTTQHQQQHHSRRQLAPTSYRQHLLSSPAEAGPSWRLFRAAAGSQHHQMLAEKMEEDNSPLIISNELAAVNNEHQILYKQHHSWSEPTTKIITRNHHAKSVILDSADNTPLRASVSDRLL